VSYVIPKPNKLKANNDVLFLINYYVWSIMIKS